MTACLLDTNVVSEMARRRPDPLVAAFLSRTDDAYLSVITVHELVFGIVRSADPHRQANLWAWLAGLQEQYADRILPVDRGAADRSARLRAAAARAGKVLHLADALIAGTAAEHSLTIASRNTNDFGQLGVPFINPWQALS